MLHDRSRRQRITLAASLRLQQRLCLHILGTLLPGDLSIEPSGSVLNVFCGPGTCAIDLALANPQLSIVAVDADEQMLQLARTDAHAAHVTSITFTPYTPSQPLPYHDSSFDLVHVQDMPLPMAPSQWNSLLVELLRVTRPGGWLYLDALEPGPTSSVAADILLSRLRDTLLERSQCQAQGEPPFTPTVLYPGLLSAAGCSEVSYTLTPVDLGNQQGSFGHNYPLALLAAHLRAAHFLVTTQCMAQEEVDRLFAQMRSDAQSIHYCSTGMIITVTGRRRDTSNGQ